MQVVLCDICERAMRGNAFELHVIRGEAVNTEQGVLRIAQRGSTRMLYLCESCGVWLQAAMDHLSRSYREADEATQLIEPGAHWAE